MSFPIQLKRARVAAGKTQQQVADVLGVTISTYCGYETGKREPDLSKLQSIAIYLNVSVDTLLGTGVVTTTIADRLNWLMTERHLSEEQLSQGSGVPQATIRKIFVTGGEQTKLPTIRKLADYFGLTLDEFIDGENPVEFDPSGDGIELTVEVAQRLTAIRTERNMTITQVANKSGVTQSTASKVFAGIEDNPKINTLLALLGAMDATLSDIDPVAQKEKAPTHNEQELAEVDLQIINLLPFVPEKVKAGVVQILAATVDLAAAQESSGQYIQEARALAAQADSDDRQQLQRG